MSTTNASTPSGAVAGNKARRLSELRVPELRAELERRGLDRQGVKAVLVDRLHQAIKDDGEDPDKFSLDNADKKSPIKILSQSSNSQEDFDDNMDEVNMDNLIVKDEVTEEDTGNDTMDAETTVEKSEDGAKSVQSQAEKKSDVSAVDAAESKNAPKKREASEPIDAPVSKKVCKEDKKINDVNGMDVEDSINLDIGDDEFLNEEGEPGCAVPKDENLEAQGAEDATRPKSGDESQPDPVKQEAVEAADGLVIDEKQQDISRTDATGSEDSKNISIVSDADKDKDSKADTKKSSSAASSSSSPNLWVSGLSGSTRAKDLKQLCSKHGKVISAKVVTNMRTPGSRCYGYVMMASAEDAYNCIKHLHKTELHGRMISMDKAKSESSTGNSTNASNAASVGRNSRSGTQLPQRSPRRSTGNKEKDESADKKKDSPKDAKKDEHSNDPAKQKNEEGNKEKSDKSENAAESGNDESKKRSSKSKTASQERHVRDDRMRAKQNQSRHRARPPVRDFLSFDKIMKEREAQRAREHVRRARSEERRRRAAEQSLRELERRQRAEKHRQRVEKDRLALEREKLRIEREKIEREKQELHRLERERQKIERERLELERLELKRAQILLEEERGRAAAKRSYMYNSSGGSSSMLSRSKQPLPPPPPTYDRPSGRSGGDSGANSNPARFNMPMPTHLNVAAPAYETPSNSSNSNKQVERGPAPRDRPRDRDRQRDFKRDYPPAPRHTSSSHTGGGGSGNGMKYPTNGSSYEPRQPLPPGTRPRDQRYSSLEANEPRGNTGGNNIRERPTGGSAHERGGGGNSGASYRPSDTSRRSPKPTSRDHRYSDTSVPMKGDAWANTGGGGADGGGSRYSSSAISGSGAQYGDSRYGYQPAPPGSNTFQDIIRYPISRDFRPKY